MEQPLLLNFDRIFAYCFDLFQKKQYDYGPTWLLYRYSSLNDEIWRKAKRIRTLEEHNDQACIPEGRDVEYVGIINYCLMFLIRLAGVDGIPSVEETMENLSAIDGVESETLFRAYQEQAAQIRELLKRKNADYGNAWQSMSIHSMTDQVIIRVYRIKSILSHGGVCTASEGVQSQLHDIINYCVFALIKMDTALISLQKC